MRLDRRLSQISPHDRKMLPDLLHLRGTVCVDLSGGELTEDVGVNAEQDVTLWCMDRHPMDVHKDISSQAPFNHLRCS